MAVAGAAVAPTRRQPPAPSCCAAARCGCRTPAWCIRWGRQNGLSHGAGGNAVANAQGVCTRHCARTKRRRSSACMLPGRPLCSWATSLGCPTPSRTSGRHASWTATPSPTLPCNMPPTRAASRVRKGLPCVRGTRPRGQRRSCWQELGLMPAGTHVPAWACSQCFPTRRPPRRADSHCAGSRGCPALQTGATCTSARTLPTGLCLSPILWTSQMTLAGSGRPAGWHRVMHRASCRRRVGLGACQE